LYLKFNCS